ncbi:MAG: hypothetical protein ACE1ZA_15405, partial [Pseudomonadales bacterium]
MFLFQDASSMICYPATRTAQNMIRIGSCTVVCLLAFNLWATEAKTITVVHAGMLLAVPGEAPKLEQTVVLGDNLITQLLDGFVDPSSISPNAEFIDLSDMFVLPGL